MSHPFTPSSDSLQSFFSQPGRGFYIPYYQRKYSWDEDNAEQLVSDIFSGVKRTIGNNSNSVFLGTIILHDEHNVEVQLHTDTPNLLTKVCNVVDGQQRIVSLGLLACTLCDFLNATADNLEALKPDLVEFQQLATQLKNQIPALTEFYSVEIKRNSVQPPLKPLIIRAHDASSNPVSDQWTLNGNGSAFYKSNTTRFISDYILGHKLLDIETDDRLNSIINVFINYIENELDSVTMEIASGLIEASIKPQGTLYSFIDYPPNLSTIQSQSKIEQKAYYSGLLLLAACSFFMNACHVVVIDCPNESMAFDMFQALNATGTPLTAFEVFRPVIVNTCGNNYSKVLKPFVDRIDKVFDNESTASGKEELTDKVIASSALLYNGSTINNKFSVERDWLVDNFTPYPDPLASEFVCLIADQAEYRNQFIRPRKSPRNSQNFGLVTHLQNLGLNSGQADLSALCVFYLRDAGHQFAHSVISVFYAKLLRAQGNTQKVAAAAEEFLAVCKATAAFFTLWMGALQGRFPDPVYRQLFQTEGSNMSLVEGKPNQTSTFVKEKLKAALQEQGIFDAKSISQSRQKWISKANSSQWYLKKTVCRFALFAAFNDAAPDLAKGNEGLFINGQDESASFLTCKKWHSSDYEVVEHVATREEPNKIKFSAYFDRNIYPGNKSIVDKIGNLTLLSTAVNSSIYSEWPDKVFYYWSLTQPQATVKGPSGDKLKSALKLTSIPPGHSSLTAASSYLAHLAPLAFRGINGLPWDKNFIDKRSNHLCERIFNTIGPWLN